MQRKPVPSAAVQTQREQGQVRRQPQPLDASVLRFVAGGAPKGTWLSSPDSTLAPKGTW